MLRSLYRSVLKRFRRAKESRSLRRAGVVVGSGAFLGEATTIGFGTKINGPCFLASKMDSPIIIGKYCAIAHNLRIRSRNHDIRFANIQNQFARDHGFSQSVDIRGSVEIGNSVWIGDNVMILSGVKVGDGAVIGAGSVVTRNISSYSVACGIPARELKQRFASEVVDLLMRASWWNWSEGKILRNKAFFEADLSNLKANQIEKILVD